MLLTRCRYDAALFAAFLLLTVPHVGAQTTAPISGQQLDDLVAPVALYPDSLVAQVLAASTYPIEIAEAQQWVTDHPKWKPPKLMDEAKKQTWESYEGSFRQAAEIVDHFSSSARVMIARPSES
jgi:hypothetical protein